MQIEPIISYRNVDASPAVTEIVNRRVGVLSAAMSNAAQKDKFRYITVTAWADGCASPRQKHHITESVPAACGVVRCQ